MTTGRLRDDDDPSSPRRPADHVTTTSRPRDRTGRSVAPSRNAPRHIYFDASHVMRPLAASDARRAPMCRQRTQGI